MLMAALITDIIKKNLNYLPDLLRSKLIKSESWKLKPMWADKT